MKCRLFIGKVAYILVVIGVLQACRATKKRVVPDALPQKYTSTPLLLVDSLLTHSVLYETFSAKLKINYSDGRTAMDFNGTLRMQKDSAVWLSLYGPFGIEGARVFITRDSFYLHNKLSGENWRQSISYVKQYIPIKTNLQTIQYYLMGYALPLPYNTISCDTTRKMYSYRAQDATFQYTAEVNQSNYTLLESLLIDRLLNQRLRTTFDAHEPVEATMFAMQRKIFVTQGNQERKIEVEFSKLKTNQPVQFPFEK